MFTTPKGFSWICGDAACLAARDEWATGTGEKVGNDSVEIVHCATEHCHGVVWTEKGAGCELCNKWYCMTCWQSKGRFTQDNCYIGPCCTGARLPSSRERGRALWAKKKAKTAAAAPR